MAKSESQKGSAKLPADIQSMLNQMHVMSADIEKKLSGVYDKSGRSREELTNYLENPNNFTKTQWERMESIRESLREKVYAAIGKKKAKKIEDDKKKAKMDKNRKGKTLGSRKGWMPMR